jgi:hypothetical protein
VGERLPLALVLPVWVMLSLAGWWLLFHAGAFVLRWFSQM